MDDLKLLEIARQARERAYVPYSKFKVGAALLCKDGTVVTGCNVENASYGLTCCAERTAIFKAVSEGWREFKAIAVIGDTEGVCAPCGACRQVMAEFAPKMRVIIGNLAGQAVTMSVSEILPLAFTPADLDR
jgi:cytidine deaminase